VAAECGEDFAHRQAHHVVARTLDARDKARARVLDAVSAGLVERRTARDVLGDFVDRKQPKSYAADDRKTVGDGARRRDREGGYHRMRIAGERLEHRARLCGIGGLAEDLPVAFDDGVGGEDERGRPARGNVERFFGRHPQGEIDRAFALATNLVDPAFDYFEAQAGRLEQRFAARRGGGENERDGIPMHQVSVDIDRKRY
jgi:hypothetical protein